jgi:hypothetical protein
VDLIFLDVEFVEDWQDVSSKRMLATRIIDLNILVFTGCV